MKMLIGLCLVSSALMLGGCAKDAEFDEFIKENDGLSKDIKGAKDGEEGKKVWEGKKADLKKKFDAIKEVRGFQVKDETRKKFEESITNAATAVCDPTASGHNPDVCKDYGELFK